MKLNLRPCPLCGSEMQRMDYSDFAGFEFMRHPTMPNGEHCQLENFAINATDDPNRIRSWNTRASDDTIKALTEALEPFAKFADDVDKWRHGDNSTCEHRIKASDLRRARSALSLTVKDERT